MLILATVIFGFLLWWLLKTDRSLVSKGNLLPGPRAWPLIGNSFTTPKTVKDTLNHRARLINEFGDVCRVWVNNRLEITLNDPRDIEVILKHPKEVKKSPEYDFMKGWLGTGLILSPVPLWSQRRKALMPAFHFKILDRFVNVFNVKTSELVDNLKRARLPGEVDLQNEVKKMFVGIICETAMGIKADEMTSYVAEYSKAIKEMTQLITYRTTKFYLFNDFLWTILGWRAKEMEISKRVRGVVEKIIREKEMELNSKQNEETIETEDADETIGIAKKTAFLEMLLKMKQKGDPAFTSNQDVIDETNTFFFGGHDTTTTATCFALEMLSRHPTIQDDLYEELKSCLTDSNVITASDLQTLPLLDRVCKETLRLFPSVPLMSRELMNDLTLPSGYVLPKGAIVVVSIYHVHRHPKYYKNPTKFDPDNFLPEEIAERHPFAFIPFSAGPRNCIGQKFSLLEYKMTVAKLVYNFKIELPEGAKTPLNEFHNVVLVADNDHKFVLSAR